MGDCEHSWKTGPVTHHSLLRCQAVCTTCWALGELSYAEAQSWPKWSDADYEANKETVERIFG